MICSKKLIIFSNNFEKTYHKVYKNNIIKLDKASKDLAILILNNDEIKYKFINFQNMNTIQTRFKLIKLISEMEKNYGEKYYIDFFKVDDNKVIVVFVPKKVIYKEVEFAKDEKIKLYKIIPFVNILVRYLNKLNIGESAKIHVKGEKLVSTLELKDNNISNISLAELEKIEMDEKLSNWKEFYVFFNDSSNINKKDMQRINYNEILQGIFI